MYKSFSLSLPNSSFLLLTISVFKLFRMSQVWFVFVFFHFLFLLSICFLLYFLQSFQKSSLQFLPTSIFLGFIFSRCLFHLFIKEFVIPVSFILHFSLSVFTYFCIHHFSLKNHPLWYFHFLSRLHFPSVFLPSQIENRSYLLPRLSSPFFVTLHFSTSILKPTQSSLLFAYILTLCFLVSLSPFFVILYTSTSILKPTQSSNWIFFFSRSCFLVPCFHKKVVENKIPHSRWLSLPPLFFYLTLEFFRFFSFCVKKYY